MFGMLRGDCSMLQCNIHFHSHLAPSNNCTFPPHHDIMNHNANPQESHCGKTSQCKEEAPLGDQTWVLVSTANEIRVSETNKKDLIGPLTV